MANEFLLAVNDGDKETGVEINLANHTISAGGSGSVPNGNYKLKINDSAWKTRKSGGSKNLWCDTRVMDERYAGIPVRIDHPAPVGDNEATGRRFLSDLVFSTCEAAGTTERARTQPFKVSPKWLIGREFFARLEQETSGEYAGRSKVVRYLTKAEYEANPGPDKDFVVESKPQTMKPEVAPNFPGMPQNGATTAKGSTATDQMLGI